MKKVISLLLVSILSFCAFAQNGEYDVIVYGGTSSGVIAAYSAAKEGLNVALIERNAHVGGITTSGL